MVEKGFLRVEIFHGLKTFVAGQHKLETMANLIRSFSQNVLGSEAPLPAAAFTGSKLLSPDEIEELEDLLDSMEKGGGKDA